MARLVRPLVLVGLALGVVVAFVRRMHWHSAGRQVPGGVIMGDAGAYDRHGRWLFSWLFSPIAADIAAAAAPGARVLDIGCGPGRLSVQLAREHDLDVTGVDLDPAMIDRANANAAASTADGRRPTFVVGDVAALPFEDAAFDLVVSTFSMHHWSDPPVGLQEIARVLRLDGRALIWDINAGSVLFHRHAPDPASQVVGGPLRVIDARPWRWPWRFTFSQRLELARVLVPEPWSSAEPGHESDTEQDQQASQERAEGGRRQPAQHRRPGKRADHDHAKTVLGRDEREGLTGSDVP